MATKTLIMVPTQGPPYIMTQDFVSGKQGALELLQKSVGGHIQPVAEAKQRVRIHPAFEASNDTSWRQVGKLIKKAPKTYLTLWCNENGMNVCSVNVAVLLECVWGSGRGGYRSLFGDLVVQVSTKWFNKNRKNYMGILTLKERDADEIDWMDWSDSESDSE